MKNLSIAVLLVLVSLNVEAQDYNYNFYKESGRILKWWRFPIHYGIAGLDESREVKVRKFVNDFSTQTGLAFVYDGKHEKAIDGERKNTIYLGDVGVLAVTSRYISEGEIAEADIALSEEVFQDDTCLNYVIYHELCHFLGLVHVPNNGEYCLMQEGYPGVFNGIDASTLAGLEVLYGKAWKEPEPEPEPKPVVNEKDEDKQEFGKLFWMGKGLSLRGSGASDRFGNRQGFYGFLDLGFLTGFYSEDSKRIKAGMQSQVILPLWIFHPYAGLGFGWYSPKDDALQSRYLAVALIGMNLKLPGTVGFFAEARKELWFQNGWKNSKLQLMEIHAGICFNLWGGAF